MNGLKYKQNLLVENDRVYSYASHVTNIVGNELHVYPEFEHSSNTTSKHINHVADAFGLKKVITDGLA